MKPLIGVTQERVEDFFQVSKSNVLAIEQAGGIPVILTYPLESEDIEQLGEQLDGLYLTGGDDIDPIYFDEEPHPDLGSFNPDRDTFEMNIAKRMLAKNKPILGVCKGAQILNLAAGGDMYQDIYSQISQSLYQHKQKASGDVVIHSVELKQDSLLHQLVGKKKIRVNSFHHQANRKVGKGFIVSGKADDGIIEAIESTEHRFALGLQWHPEKLISDPSSIKIYRGFISACDL